MTDPLVGRNYGGYRLERKLAEGGMGVIYLGVNEQIGRRAAVKVLKLEYCQDEGVVARFYQEARSVNEIGHPGIVDIYDFGRDPDGRVFFVMELLQGESLAGRLKRGPQSWAETRAIIDQTCAALAAAHEKGFVHRDLKPDNIWIRYDPMTGKMGVKLLDFGIAKLVGLDGAQEKLTKTGAIIGTPHYMSPEQVNGANVDTRTDIYALGVILYEMLSGATPFGGETLGQILMGHLLAPVPPLPPLPPAAGVPAWVPGVIAGMLAKDPAARPQTVKEVVAQLSGAAVRTEVAAAPPMTPKRRWPLVVAGVAVLAIGGSIAAVVIGSGPAPAVHAAAPAAPTPQPKPAPAPAPAAVDYDKLRAEALALLRGTPRAAEPAVRVLGADALGEVRDRPSTTVLAGLVEKDPDDEVRGHAAGALGQIGLDRQTRALLAKLVGAVPPPLQVWLDEALARAGDADARKRLADLGQSRDLGVAFKAALAYADTAAPGDAEAVKLLTALAAREAELNQVAPYAGAVLLARLGKLRVSKARAILLTTLEGNDERARLAAAEALGRLGDDSGKKAAQAVLASDGSPNRLVAANILVGLGDYSGYPLMKEKLGDADPDTRRLAARGLGLVGEKESLPALQARLGDAAWPVKIAAAAALLATIGLDPRLLAQNSVDWTESALASDDWAVRRSAAALVGEVPEREALPLLAQALADPAPEVRRAAAKSARKVKAADATKALVAAVKAEPDAPAREEMVKALGARKDPSARAALTAISAERGRAGVLASGALVALGDADAGRKIEAAAADKTEEVRAAAVEAAAGAKLMPVLLKAVGDPILAVRFVAAESLASLGDKGEATLAALRDGASAPDPGVRARAVAALLHLGEPIDKLPVPPVAELLADDDARVRAAALSIVAALAADQALPLLRRALFDPELEVRRSALDVVDGFLAADKDGVIKLDKLVLRDPDPYMRAKAGFQLAGLMPPILPELAPDAPRPTDDFALDDAGAQARAAHDEAAALRESALAQAAALDKAVAVPARDDASLRAVEKLVGACQDASQSTLDVRRRGEVALLVAERAAGDKPEGDAVRRLDETRALVKEARGWLDETARATDAAVKRGRAYLQIETGDAATYTAAAEAEIVAGKLADAKKDLDKAARLLHGKDATSLRYSYGVLTDKLAGREKTPAKRLALLKQAKAYFDEFAARGSGPRVAAAKQRSDELADEIRELEGQK